MTDKSFYDEDYFKGRKGKSNYTEDYWDWGKKALTYQNEARRMIELFKPMSVLECGCALGFFVRAFRDLGVEAYGIDISKWAVDHVHSSIRDFVWQHTLGEKEIPFHMQFDLTLCIDVLEHITDLEPHWYCSKAIQDVCRATNKYVIVQMPCAVDENEPMDQTNRSTDKSHCNIRQPAYWCDRFFHEGFILNQATRLTDHDYNFVFERKA